MKKVNIQPLGDRVVIQSMEAEQKTASGIIIPNTAKEKPQQGTIVAIGDKLESNIKINDTVLYGKYSGTEVELQGESYLIMNESDILAII